MDVLSGSLLCLESGHIHAAEEMPLFGVMYSASLMSYPMEVD